MYEVGDVVYIISNKKRNVVPVQIVEQIVRRSLSGEAVTFKVALPGKDKSETIDLHGIDGSVYKTLPDARRYLYEQASAAINNLLFTAAEVSKKHFGVDPELAVSSEPVPQNQTADKNPSFDLSLPQLPLETPPMTNAASTSEGNVLDFTSVEATGEVRVEMPDGTYASVQLPEMQ
jgi:hypothetical protein